MSRFVSSQNETAAAANTVRLLILVDLDFTSGHLYAHDAIGEVSFGGNTYLGVGKFGGIDALVEDIDAIAKPCTLTLSGVDPDLLATTLTESYQGRSAKIYLGLLHLETAQFIDTPELSYEGQMDYMTVEVSDTATIALHIENRLRREPLIARYTDEDQQLIVPGDKGFNRVPDVAIYDGVWGDKKSSYKYPGRSSGGAGALPIPFPRR